MGGAFLDDGETPFGTSYISGPVLQSPQRSPKTYYACMLLEELKTAHKRNLGRFRNTRREGGREVNWLIGIWRRKAFLDVCSKKLWAPFYRKASLRLPLGPAPNKQIEP